MTCQIANKRVLFSPRRTLIFHPQFCPNQDCDSRQSTTVFRFRRRGHFRRKCDGRCIPRFCCVCCNRGFSSQTFRGNYRCKLPTLHHQLMPLLCSKVTRRQAARILGVNRKAVELRFRKFAHIAKEFHISALERCRSNGGFTGTFQLDELETYEHNRRIKPVTVAVTMERNSYFVLGADPGTMASRSPLSEKYQQRKQAIEKEEGLRCSQSRIVVQRSLDRLGRYLSSSAIMRLQSDMKKTYPAALAKAAGGRLFHHELTNSKDRRDYGNQLFPVNHTLAMMRDGMSCLVRRNWAGPKKKSGLQRHFWIWIAWRNYVRGITGRTRTTPAQALGVMNNAITMQDLYFWRWPKFMSQLHSNGGQIQPGPGLSPQCNFLRNRE